MASSSSTTNAVPPWLELPREITAAILQKVGPIDIFTAAEKVCTAWRSLCRDPSMWRCIDMRYADDLWDKPYSLEKMCRTAVDRSQGQLIDISIEYFGSDDLLLYISQRSSNLKRLQLVFPYNISSEGVMEAAKNFPQLEELHLYYIYIDAKAIEAVGRACPLLKSFKLNNRWYRHPEVVCDLQAQAIAENMPELRHLQLFGNRMTNEGLQAIINGCPHLESLDIRQCLNVHFGGDIGRLCSQRIKDLRLPHDPTNDYRFDSEIFDYASSDDDYIGGMSDIDMVSDYDDHMEFSEASISSIEIDDDEVFSD